MGSAGAASIRPLSCCHRARGRSQGMLHSSPPPGYLLLQQRRADCPRPLRDAERGPPPERQSGGRGLFSRCSHGTCLCCSRQSWGWAGGLGWGEGAHRGTRGLLVQKGAMVWLFPVDFLISLTMEEEHADFPRIPENSQAKSHGGRNWQDYLKRELNFNGEK